MAAERRSSGGFTLIELLVVIAVIAVPMPFLFPVLSKAREAGRRAACLGNLHQLQIAWQTYADDHDGSVVNGQASYPGMSGGPAMLPENSGDFWLVGLKGPWPVPQTLAGAEAWMRTGALARYIGNDGVASALPGPTLGSVCGDEDKG